MRFTTYSKYRGKWLDALNLESLLEHLSDFLMDGGSPEGRTITPTGVGRAKRTPTQPTPSKTNSFGR